MSSWSSIAAFHWSVGRQSHNSRGLVMQQDLVGISLQTLRLPSSPFLGYAAPGGLRQMVGGYWVEDSSLHFLVTIPPSILLVPSGSQSQVTGNLGRPPWLFVCFYPRKAGHVFLSRLHNSIELTGSNLFHLPALSYGSFHLRIAATDKL